jgi:hypothetical protein
VLGEVMRRLINIIFSCGPLDNAGPPEARAPGNAQIDMPHETGVIIIKKTSLVWWDNVKYTG